MPVSRRRPQPKRKPRKKPEPRWESFERVVAAIHLAETKGAQVTWNEIIEGRQFDVTIRFKVGFYEYLTLIECRDYNKPVQVEKVEAFVTKARHHKANKAIMVSAHGFQSGAKEVARRENIELYSLRQIERLPDDVLTDIFLSFVVVQPFAFRHNGEPAFVFARDPNTLSYQLENIRFTGYANLKLGDLIIPFTQLVHPTPLPGVPDIEKEGFSWKRATAARVKGSWRMMENTRLILPGGGGEISVSEFLFIYWAETVRLRNTGGVDPSVLTSFGKQYEYRNELNDDVVMIDPMDLPLGINTVFEKGRFYTQPQLKDFLYYCEEVWEDMVTLLLLRSYQHGRLVRMEMREPVGTSNHYVEVTDEEEIGHAGELLDSFLELRKNNPPQAVNEVVKIWFTEVAAS